MGHIRISPGSVCIQSPLSGLICIALLASQVLGFPSRPIIGILLETHTIDCGIDNPYKTTTDYKVYIEQAGGSAVPIFPNQAEEYYRKLLSVINGALFPGGSVDLVKSPYAKAAQIIFAFAKEMNAGGTYFPLWGTCLGFQELVTLPLHPKKNVLTPCVGVEGIDLPFLPTKAAPGSRLFGSLPDYIYSIMMKSNVLPHFHQFCLATATYEAEPQLTEFYDVLSINKDSAGLEFVSTVEAKSFPFYGTQWHPEKDNLYFSKSKSVTQSRETVLVSQYFANFLVEEARKNNQSFLTFEAESRFLFENYKPVYNATLQYEYYCLSQADIPNL